MITMTITSETMASDHTAKGGVMRLKSTVRSKKALSESV